MTQKSKQTPNKESIPGLLLKSLGRFLQKGSLYRPASQATQAGGIDSLESIPGLLKSLQIRALMETGA